MIGLVALALFAVWEHRLRPPVAGDEPVYLVQAESLWVDHDVDLSNNFGANARIAGQLAAPLTPPKNVRRLASGEILPGQPIGMGVLLAPAVAIGHRGSAEVNWARRLMMVLAALLIWQLFELLADHTGLVLAGAVTAGVTLSLPVLSFSNQLYPEVPAALLLALGLRAVLRPAGARVLAAGVIGAALPWLSMRYLPLGLGLVAAAIWRASTPRTDTETGTAWSWTRVVAGVAPLVVGTALMAAVDSWVFHAPSPVAQSVMNTYRIGVGGLFSPVFGLLPIAPQFALGIAGVALIALVHRSAIAVVAGVVLYEFVGSPFGFRGYALPGRFQIVLVPVLALAIGLLIAAYPRLVVVFVATVAIGGIVVFEGGRQPTYGRLYQDGARPNVPVLRGVAHALPDFSLAPGHSGVVLKGSDLDPLPPIALRQGRFAVAVGVRTSGLAEVTVSVATDGAARRATPLSSARQRIDGDGIVNVALDVDRSGTEYQFGVMSTQPSAVVRTTSLTIRPVGPVESRTAPSRRDLPLGLGWMLVAVVASVGAYVGARRSRVRTGAEADGYPREARDPANE